VFSTALEDGLTSVKMMGFADISDDEIRRILSEHDCRVQDAIGAIISANESAREAKLQEDDIPAHRDPMPITSPAARPSVPSPAAEPCSTFADPEQAELVDSLTRMLLMPSDFNSLASSSSFPSPSSYPPREPCDAPANTPQTSDPTAVSHRTLSPLSLQAASFEPNPGQLSWGRPAPIVDQDGFTVLPQPALLQASCVGNPCDRPAVTAPSDLNAPAAMPVSHPCPRAQVVPSRAAAKGPRDRGALAAESARGDAALDPHMLVLVGVPGSGKSTLAKVRRARPGSRARALAPPLSRSDGAAGTASSSIRNGGGRVRAASLAGLTRLGTAPQRLEERGWACVNQDTLGSRRRCEEECAAALAAGRRVVIDRTNIDEAQRAHWLAPARSSSRAVRPVQPRERERACLRPSASLTRVHRVRLARDARLPATQVAALVLRVPVHVCRVSPAQRRCEAENGPASAHGAGCPAHASAVVQERVMSRTGHKTLPPERSRCAPGSGFDWMPLVSVSESTSRCLSARAVRRSLGIVDKFAGELRLPRESEGFARVVEVRDSSDSVVQRLLALDP